MKIDRTRSKKRQNYQKQHTANAQGYSFRTLLGNFAKGLVAQLVIGTLLLVLIAAILIKLDDPTRLIPSLALLALYVTAFAGGFITYSINRHGVAICGFVAAALLLLVLLCVSMACGINSQSFGNGLKLVLKLACIPAGLIGAYAASKLPTRKRRRS